MKLFFDLEFTGLHKYAELISIGIVSEDGKRTFYAENSLVDYLQCDEWIQDNVVKNLTLNCEPFNPVSISDNHVLRSRPDNIRDALEKWLAQFDTVEMWSDCYAYDWVVFCDLWGGAMNIPKSIYYIPFDLSTAFRMKDVDADISREQFAGTDSTAAKHNALFDAQVIRSCYQKLMEDK